MNSSCHPGMSRTCLSVAQSPLSSVSTALGRALPLQRRRQASVESHGLPYPALQQRSKAPLEDPEDALVALELDLQLFWPGHERKPKVWHTQRRHGPHLERVLPVVVERSTVLPQGQRKRRLPRQDFPQLPPHVRSCRDAFLLRCKQLVRFLHETHGVNDLMRQHYLHVAILGFVTGKQVATDYSPCTGAATAYSSVPCNEGLLQPSSLRLGRPLPACCSHRPQQQPQLVWQLCSQRRSWRGKDPESPSSVSCFCPRGPAPRSIFSARPWRLTRVRA